MHQQRIIKTNCFGWDDVGMDCAVLTHGRCVNPENGELCAFYKTRKRLKKERLDSVIRRAKMGLILSPTEEKMLEGAGIDVEKEVF